MSTVEIFLVPGPSATVVNEKTQCKEFNTEWWETTEKGGRVLIDKNENFSFCLSAMASAEEISVHIPANTNFRHVNLDDVTNPGGCQGNCFMCGLAKTLDKLPTPYILRRFALKMEFPDQVVPKNVIGNHHLKVLEALGRYSVPLTVIFPLLDFDPSTVMTGNIRALHLYRRSSDVVGFNGYSHRECYYRSIDSTHGWTWISHTWLTQFSLLRDCGGAFDSFQSIQSNRNQPMDEVLWMRHFVETGDIPPAAAGFGPNYKMARNHENLAYALRVQRARISNMHDIFTLIMCAQRRGNHPLFSRTNRDVLRKIFSFLRPADWSDEATAAESATKRRRKMSSLLEPRTPAWVAKAGKEYEKDLTPLREEKEREDRALRDWNETQANLAQNIKQWQRKIANVQHLLDTSAERLVTQEKKVQVTSQKYEQQLAAFREKYKNF